MGFYTLLCIAVGTASILALGIAGAAAATNSKRFTWCRNKARRETLTLGQLTLWQDQIIEAQEDLINGRLATAVTEPDGSVMMYTRSVNGAALLATKEIELDRRIKALKENTNA